MSTTVDKRFAPQTEQHDQRGNRLSEKSDEDLLVEYRESGDRRLFSELVHRYEQELYSYLRRYLGDAEMAEDVFQAAFMQVHLKSGLYQKGRKFRPWLYAIATNQGIDAQRRGRRHRMVSLDQNSTSNSDEDLGSLLDLLTSGEQAPPATLELAEQREWVRNEIEQLSDQMRQVIDLVYYRGLKYREAAEILSIPVGTVKSRLHSAVWKLNEAWHNSELGRK